MEDSCPPTPLHFPSGRDSKSPLQVALSSPDSDRMKSPSDRLSPDSRCVICLGRLQNKSFTDSCLHQFCFQCLLQWSKVKPECPLCKQPFKSIIHNVRSNEEYDQYHIERGESGYSLSGFLQSYNIDLIRVHPHPRRFRNSMTPEYFREIAGFIARSRQMEDPYQIPPLVPVDATPSQSLRRPNRHHHYNGHRSSMRHRSTSDFRRSIYNQDLWVQDLADVSGRYRECTPQFYRNNPSQVHRVIPWLNREVNVLLEFTSSHALHVIDKIVETLTQHSIRSREFRAVVQPYFGVHTDHFIHEFYTFARSVYDMSGFDENAIYSSNPNYATEVQEILSSNDDDSDIEVIETVRNGDSQKLSRPKDGFKKILLKRAGGSSNLDEPVAGPSGLNNLGIQEPIEVCESDGDEVEVLDYVKPEPELVTLSSGEEEEVEENNPNVVHFSDLDLSNGDFAEIPDNLSEDEETISNPIQSSDDNYEPYKKSTKYKSPKGKCKSGVGLKGKQKKKYIRSKTVKKDTSDNSSSSGEDNRSRRSGTRRRRLTSTSSSSSSSSSSISSISSSSSSSNSSIDRIYFRCRKRNISSSDDEPISKYISRKKETKTKIHRKSKKSKSDKKSSEKRKRKVRKESKKEKDKRKVKSCVVVPKVRHQKSSARASRRLSISSDDSSRPLGSYWSDIRNSGKSSKIILKRKRSTSSSHENTSRAKYSSRIVNSDESSRDSYVDVINTTKNSSDVYSNYSDSLFLNSCSSNRSDNDLPRSSASVSHNASSSSDIKINVSSDYSD